MEAAVVERLRRHGGIPLHPHLVHAPLIYDDRGRKALTVIYEGYMDIASKAGVPLLLCTPTWRANRERVAEAQLEESVNVDAVRFMKELRDKRGSGDIPIRVGGLIGCWNDSYRPEEALPAGESERFHSWQITQLAGAGVDFLVAETLPNIEEATGIARAMEKTSTPYIISFVIDRSGCLLDGTELVEAVGIIDSSTKRKPLGFMVNCAYPSFLCAAKQPNELFQRLIGYQANASSLDHSDLDGSEQLETESVADWGEEMLALNRNHGVKILGGCCGTGEEHLRYLVQGGEISSLRSQ